MNTNDNFDPTKKDPVWIAVYSATLALMVKQEFDRTTDYFIELKRMKVLMEDAATVADWESEAR